MFSADLDLEDFFKFDGTTTTTTTKAPPKVVPKAPTGTKAPVKPKPKPGERVYLRLSVRLFSQISL